MDPRLSEWLALPAGDPNYQLCVLQGGGGTGKTELIKSFSAYLDQRNVKYGVVAYTNKAAKVLRQRGVKAQTIHSVCFSATATGRMKTVLTPLLDPTTLKPSRDADRKIIMKSATEPEFEYAFDEKVVRDKVLGSGAGSETPVLLLLDEASMVPAPIWRHLLTSRSIRILACGDVNQLPPIESEILALRIKAEQTDDPEIEAALADLEMYQNLFHRVTPDIVLTVNYRQNSGSDIIALTDEILAKGRYSRYSGKDVTVIAGARWKAHAETLAMADAVVAWQNKTVDALNLLIRSVKYRDAFRTLSAADQGYPQHGDKLYVTSRYTDGVTTLFTKGDIVEIVDEPAFDHSVGVACCMIRRDDGFTAPVALSLAAFGNKKRLPGMKTLKAGYGYCLTAHKAQGSQWPHVVVVDEHSRYSYKQWIYTASTRAQTTLTVFDGGLLQ